MHKVQFNLTMQSLFPFLNDNLEGFLTNQTFCIAAFIMKEVEANN